MASAMFEGESSTGSPRSKVQGVGDSSLDRKFTNPLAAMGSGDMVTSADFHGSDDGNEDGMDPTAKPRKVFTEAEVADLRFAFEACCEGAAKQKGAEPVLTVTTMVAMLRALGTDIADHEVFPLVRAAKASLLRNIEREQAIKDAENTGIQRVLKVPFKGIFHTDNTKETQEDQVNFSQFFLLMTNDVMIPHLPNGEWVAAAHHFRILYYAFTLSDSDDNGELEFEELNACINNLHSGNLTTADIQAIWAMLNPDGKGFIDFLEFIKGMEDVIKDPVLGEKFNLFGHNFLLSMIVDTPVSEAEEKQIKSKFGFLERLGMSAAARDAAKSQRAWTPEHRKEVMKRAEERTTHILTESQRSRLNQLHHWNVGLGFMIGFISATISACWETWIGWELDTDGTSSHYHCIPDRVADTPECTQDGVCGCLGSNSTHKMTVIGEEDSCEYFAGISGDCEWLYRWDEHPGFPYCDWVFPDINSIDPVTGEPALAYIEAGECEMSSSNSIVMFWVLNGGVLIMCCLVEILCLYWFSIKNAVNVATALDLVLLPMNRDRAFVSNTLVRAALEMGPDNEPVYGVDPLVERSNKEGAFSKILKGLYMAKIVLSGFILKIVLKRVLGRVAAKGSLAFMAIPATSLWNALVAHVIMREAKLRGLGISTGVEVFQDIMCVLRPAFVTHCQSQSSLLAMILEHLPNI